MEGTSSDWHQLAPAASSSGMGLIFIQQCS